MTAGPVRIVVCPDKFRGSASADEAGAAIAAGIRAARPDTDVVVCPIADGGEGTVSALARAGWQLRQRTVTGPAGQPVHARFAVAGTRAVIELAQASGAALLEGPTRRTARTASTYGTGELLRAALDERCTDLVLTVGGSATTDAGAGMLAALGARLLTGDGTAVPPGGVGLEQLAELDLHALDPRLADTSLQVATDVDVPLLGPRGAARLFGPQKGASAQDVADLERALTHFADVVARTTARDHRNDPGAGAAGGTGFAALAALGATRISGVAFMLRELRVGELLAGAELVVVGEGSIDDQTLAGKAPVGVADLAAAAGVPVVAVAGRIEVSADRLAQHGIVRGYALTELAPPGTDTMRDAQPYLVAAGRQLVTDVLSR